MARKIQKIQKDRGGIAIIVDGKDEQWYINKVKEDYSSEKLERVKVKPELPTQKKEEDERKQKSKSLITRERTQALEAGGEVFSIAEIE